MENALLHLCVYWCTGCILVYWLYTVCRLYRLYTSVLAVYWCKGCILVYMLYTGVQGVYWCTDGILVYRLFTGVLAVYWCTGCILVYMHAFVAVLWFIHAYKFLYVHKPQPTPIIEYVEMHEIHVYLRKHCNYMTIFHAQTLQ